MKIGPVLPPPAAPLTQPPAPAEPSRPFEELLDTAYGFSELGVFGHDGEKTPGPGPGTCRGPAPEAPGAPAVALEPLSLSDADEAANEPMMIPHARTLTDHRVPTGADRVDAGRAVAPARAKPAARATELPLPEPAPQATESEPESPVAPARRAARRAPAKADVSLIVTEKDGRVGLIAGAPRLDPEARAALRRLVREILGRSGLSLAYFRLNGAPIAADTLNSQGGTHGTRSG